MDDLKLLILMYSPSWGLRWQACTIWRLNPGPHELYPLSHSHSPSLITFLFSCPRRWGLCGSCWYVHLTASLAVVVHIHDIRAPILEGMSMDSLISFIYSPTAGCFGRFCDVSIMDSAGEIRIFRSLYSRLTLMSFFGCVSSGFVFLFFF